MRHTVAGLLLGLASGAAMAADELPDDSHIGRIEALRSLHYGEVLFHYYQQQHFPALVGLRAAEASQRLGPHGEQAALLDGSLALAYRMPKVAEQRFRAVLDGGARSHTRQRAWLALGKLQHRRGEAESALASLDSAAAIKGLYAPERDAELRLLRAQIQHQLGQPQRAVALLQDEVDWPEHWQPYATYNLAAAQFDLGDSTAAEASLAQVAALQPFDLEQYALADRARLGLGLQLLREGRAEQAGEQLRSVRLDGPFSDKALLAAGWASAEADNLPAALRQWDALAARDSAAPAVQEALLASGYARAKQGDHAGAAGAYDRALQRLDDEQIALDAAQDSLLRGELFAQLADAAEPGAITRYLPLLQASHAFRQGLAEYRDLGALIDNLDHWSRSIIAFDDMLDTREQRYAQHQPAADQSLSALDLAALRQRRDVLRQRFEQADAQRDLLALASAERRAQQLRLDQAQLKLNGLLRRPGLQALIKRHDLIRRSLDMPYMSGEGEEAKERPEGVEHRLRARIERIEQMIKRLPGQTDIAALMGKLKLLRGVQLWQLEQDWPQRRRRAEKSLNQLDLALAEAERGESALQTAVERGPERFLGQRQRISDFRERLAALQARLQPTRERQRARLEQWVADDLAARGQRLARYRAEARLALAQNYDLATRAAEGGE